MVTITSPGNGTVFRGNGNINISVSATDPAGIDSIVINGDSISLKTCTNTGSCSGTWQGKNIPQGTHIVSATAINKLGQGTKSAVSITALR
jgi:hypothetical protein